MEYKLIKKFRQKDQKVYDNARSTTYRKWCGVDRVYLSWKMGGRILISCEDVFILQLLNCSNIEQLVTELMYLCLKKLVDKVWN